MRGGPQDAGSIIEIAVALDIDGQAAVLLVGQSGADSRGRAISDAISAATADELVMFVEVPQPGGPVTDEIQGGHERPVFVLDLVPQLGRQARSAHRARIPTGSSQFKIALTILVVLRG